MKSKDIILSVLAVVIFIYTLWSFIDWYKERQDKTWSSEQVEGMIQKCISSSKFLSNYSDQQQAYDICKCATDSLITSYTYDEIWDLDKLSIDTLKILMMPIMEKCMTPYLEDIKMDDYISDCIEVAKKTVNIEKARSYCHCMIPYLIEKYGSDSIPPKDFLLKYEKEKIIECVENN